MSLLKAGKVWGGGYKDGQLVINDVNLGELTVVEDDADSVLRNAIGAVPGVSAELDENNCLVITCEGTMLIGGSRPLGLGGSTVEELNAGTYE